MLSQLNGNVSKTLIIYLC